MHITAALDGTHAHDWVANVQRSTVYKRASASVL
jgi:hypothetical protein